MIDVVGVVNRHGIRPIACLLGNLIFLIYHIQVFILPERCTILLLLVNDCFILNGLGSLGELEGGPGLIQS